MKTNIVGAICTIATVLCCYALLCKEHNTNIVNDVVITRRVLRTHVVDDIADYYEGVFVEKDKR